MEVKLPTRDQVLKADGGKPMLELLPPSLLLSVGKIMTYGANKYGANNWRKVEPERYLGAMLRHLAAFMEDPNSVDEESGYLHVEHMLCNAAYINDFIQKGTYKNETDSESGKQSTH